MRSLKTRLLLWIPGTAAGILVVAIVTLYGLARVHRIGLLDRAVVNQAKLLASMIEIEGDTLDLGFEELDLSAFETPEGGWFLEVWLDGQSIHHSPSLDGFPSPRSMRAAGPSVATWCDLPGPRPGRGIVLELHWAGEPAGGEPGDLPRGPPGAEPGIALFVGTDATGTLASLRWLAVTLTALGAAAVVVMAAVLAFVVSRSMRPVDAVAASINRIGVDDLHLEIDASSLPVELQPIVTQFNGLLRRIHAAFERETAFCSDVAHELRTPLSGLRTTLEVGKVRHRDHAEQRKQADHCLAMVIQAQDLIEKLLEIARFENGQLALRPESIHLNERIAALWEETAAGAAEERQCRLEQDLRADGAIRSDPRLVDIVLRNLFANAITYVNDGGAMTVSAALDADGATIVVTNSGSRVASDDVHRVFDRFWRGDTSRTNPGFGLGLSLAQRAAAGLGGTLAATSQLDGIFRVRFTFPPIPGQGA